MRGLFDSQKKTTACSFYSNTAIHLQNKKRLILFFYIHADTYDYEVLLKEILKETFIAQVSTRL